MGLKKNKKAFLFTILIILLLYIFLISYGIYYIHEDKTSVKKRIETLDSFVFSVEEDLSRQLYASGFRMIFAIQTEIINTGNYIENYNSSFQELFFNGNLNGNYEDIMTGINLNDIINTLNYKANKVSAIVDFNNVELIVSQESPWEVKFNLVGDLIISDKGNVALWNKSKGFSAYVPITGFEDPVYFVNTNGLVINKLNKTIFDYFVDGEDVSNLNEHLVKSYYIHSNLAPSFLNRLEGNFSANENGIESFVYLPKLSNIGIPVLKKSVIDYIYFSETNPTAYNIKGMPSWFSIDDENSERLDLYGVRELIT